MSIQRSLVLALALCLLLLLPAGCGSAAGPEDLSGKYVYEKPGFGGTFSITLKEDGSFTYYVGDLSSYIGIGQWTLTDGVLCLTDQGGRYVNYFRTDKPGQLVFQAEGSTNFMYLDVADGEAFTRQES